MNPPHTFMNQYKKSLLFYGGNTINLLIRQRGKYCLEKCRCMASCILLPIKGIMPYTHIQYVYSAFSTGFGMLRFSIQYEIEYQTITK